MSPEIASKLKRLEQLLTEKRMLEEECDTLKADLLPHLSKDTRVATEVGVFTVDVRNKWVYSSETADLADELKERQKLEQQDGTATAIPGEPFIVYRTGVHD